MCHQIPNIFYVGSFDISSSMCMHFSSYNYIHVAVFIPLAHMLRLMDKSAPSLHRESTKSLQVYTYMRMCCIALPLPHFRMNGTPSHLSLRIYMTAIAKVGVRDPFGTVWSSKYPSFASPSPNGLPTYWPRTTSSSSIGRILRSTFTCVLNYIANGRMIPLILIRPP